jgi:hypothetical protein
MNRKGDFMEFFGELVAIFIIALVLFTFFFIFSFSWGKKSDLKIMDVQIKQEKLTLLNILKTPVEEKINGLPEDSNIADLVVFSYKNNDYKDLNRILKTKENLLLKNTNCLWSMFVMEDDKIIDDIEDSQVINSNALAQFHHMQITNTTIPVNITKSLIIFYGDNLIEDQYGTC